MRAQETQHLMTGMTTRQLAAYFERVQHEPDRSLKADLETLTSLHRAHLLHISYENLDIHLGRRLSLDPSTIFDKLVTAKRGGWCYEMNGLFAWVLAKIGFNVTLLAGTVGRQSPEDDNAEGNHLVLLVTGRLLDQPYLADVGFGNGFLEPLPLKPGTYRQGFLIYGLTNSLERWYFQNQAYGGPGFDFALDSHSLSDFAQRCDWLQTAPESGFVRVTVCHRFTSDGIITLKGCVLRCVTADGVSETVIENQADYEYTLEEQFDLRLPEVGSLWQKAWHRHVEWLTQQAQ